MSVRTDREFAALTAAGWTVQTETVWQRVAAAIAGRLAARRAGWSR